MNFKIFQQFQFGPVCLKYNYRYSVIQVLEKTPNSSGWVRFVDDLKKPNLLVYKETNIHGMFKECFYLC